MLIVIAAVVPPIVTIIIPIVVPIVVPIVITVIIGAASKLGYRDAPVAIVVCRSEQAVRTITTKFSQQFIEGQNTVGIGIDGPETSGLSRYEARGKRSK